MTFIIAEVGINHNGDIDIAKELIKTAKACGADCVKFQTFKAKEFVADPKQTYTYKSQGKEVTESMLEMFERYEFTKDEWIKIKNYCEELGILFASTAQNKNDLDFLLGITNLPFIKVGSDDLTNLDLLKYYSRKGLPMIISAGMAYASEIEDAVQSIRMEGNNDITVLHCVSSYPTEPSEVNLRKIPVIRDAFGVKVGFSDHTIGSTAAIGAVCYGAKVVEKHFTLDNKAPGPDHWFSINPMALKDYVSSIRNIELAIGVGTLRPTTREKASRQKMHRKIVFSRDLPKGKKISVEDLEMKRADFGIAPKFIEFVLNRTLKNSVEANTPLSLDLLT